MWRAKGIEGVWLVDGIFGNDFVTVTDEEGNDFELEYLDTVEIDEQLYMAFLPADMDVNDEDYGIVILKVEYEGDEELLVTIDDEDECAQVLTCFNERLFSEDIDDSNNSDDDSNNSDDTDFRDNNDDG